MADIGYLIKKRREELGMTQDELAERTGYKSRSSINKLEKGGNDLPRAKIGIFARALNISPGYFVDNEDDVETLKKSHPEILPVNLRQFPLLGEIACGEPIFATENRENFVMADSDISADFCLRAKGDSMIDARIYDGDLVFIKKMPMVDNGEIAAVIIDDEATLKKVYYYPEKGKLVLFPCNTAYEPFVYTGIELNEIRILGKAVCFMSSL